MDYKQGEKKLSEEQRHVCLKMHAEGVMHKEIAAFITTTWGVPYTSGGVTKMTESKKHQDFINKCRDEYHKKIKDVPIANKRTRIDDLEKIRVKVMAALEDNKCENKGQREEFRQLVRTLNDIIINAREEMEKKPNLVPIMGLGDFSDKSDDQLIAERDDIIRQAERAINAGTGETGRPFEGTEESNSGEPS